jgi:uncharacterized protein YjbI with pentapeptide repeats
MAMVNIVGISQFGFSAFSGTPAPSPADTVVGWTSIATTESNLLISVPDASSAEMFNCYFIEQPPDTQGQAFILQSLTAKGLYVVAAPITVAGKSQTVFVAVGETQQEAAQFAIYTLGTTVAFVWFQPSSKTWLGLTNLTCADFGGNGVLAASSTGYPQPYLLPWLASQSATRWSYTPPAGWNVPAGSDLSYVDFTSVSATAFPFDFSNCKLSQTNLSGKSFGYAEFVNCDLTTTTLMPPLGASETAWIDFTGAEINYPSLGSDWQYLNLTQATINQYPVPPAPPPQINANGAILDYLNMVKWNLYRADFSNASLYNVNLSESLLEGAKFHAAKLSPIGEVPDSPPPNAANLSYAYLLDADFSDANLQGVNFAYSFLYGEAATLSGASLAQADFSNAFLAEIDFTGIYEKNLAGVTFDGACLANANFQGTLFGYINSKGFSFVGAALQGANFTDSNLQGANLTNAAIAISDPPAGGSQLNVTAVYQLGSFQLPISPITYTTATILAPTDDTTYCPSNTGPCVGTNLNPAEPSQSPQTAWPVSVPGHAAVATGLP